MRPFEEFREKYPVFYYHQYWIRENETEIELQYEFEIAGLTKFYPKLKILKKDRVFKDIHTKFGEYLVFHIGLVELISYWKCTCSPKVIIKCGYLDDNQIQWWKKLYFHGLGELFYTNGIHTNQQEFMKLTCEVEQKDRFLKQEIEENYQGYIIPIGGGKDSVVTIETLPLDKTRDDVLIINPKPVTMGCAKIAGFEDTHIIEIKRLLDLQIVELNQKGYINGHTPFSSMLAFVSYLVAYLLGRKYIALSNESSANESNVVGEEVNHQYSKSFAFENDFLAYTKTYFQTPITYFSFLRPLNELQIAKLLAKHEKYHPIFRSCNVGSKGEEWQWCCHCAKCLFVFIMLSPFLAREKVISIFGEDLFENKDLLPIFIQLIGKGENKPFDCVGTYEEVNYAITEISLTLEQQNLELPYLLAYYKQHYGLVGHKEDLTKRFNEQNNLTNQQEEILRKEVFSSDTKSN